MSAKAASVLTDEQKQQIRRAANEFAIRLMEAGTDLDVNVVKTPLHEVGKQTPTFLYHVEISTTSKEVF